MRNKGFIKTLAVLLTLICLFYLSFSIVTNVVDNKAAKMAETDSVAATAYIDSLNATPFYLWSYNLKQCREVAIGLGLDLKGGMNVTLEVSIPDVVKTLSGNSHDPAFLKAVESAKLESQDTQTDFITAFVKAYKQNAPDGKLAQIFATQQLNEKVKPTSTDAEVEKVLRAEVKSAVDNSERVLRTRIDRFGVVQPNIQKDLSKSGRIMVELPGIKEPDRVRNLLQGSANLEFWTTYDTQDVLPLLNQLNTALREAAGETAAEQAGAADTAAAGPAKASEPASADKAALARLGKAGADKKKAGQTPTEEEAVAAAKRENPLFAIFQPENRAAGCAVGYAAMRDTAEVNALVGSKTARQILPADLRLLWDVKSVDKAGKIFRLYAIRTSSGQNGRAPLTGDVVTEAKDEFDTYGNPCVSMKMNSEGARKWAALTEANINHAIAIVLDNYVYSAPNVNNKIDGGSSQITGQFTTNDTKDLANVLASGKMPAPAQIVQEDIVGPSLGAESIQAGFISFVIAFIVLMLYMCVMYGFKAGMVANSALILNFFFTLGILTSLQAALTMSGIAGMVLTLGMAVDANVLIYERTKEELKGGKRIQAAVSAGYSNAFSAIFDSNLTSLITAAILYYFGTGPIRGFATTLFIGIVCSFFTAVWLTRIVYENRFARDKWLGLTFTTSFSKNLMQGTRYNFMGIYKKSFAAFGLLLVASLVSFGLRGLSRSIDFTGGRNFKVEFAQPVNTDEVKAAVLAKFADKESDQAVNTNVIALGTDGKNIRVTTNYRINVPGTEVDAEIERMLYEAFTERGYIDSTKVSHAQFVNRHEREGGSIVSSQKVGPSIAEDITYNAIWSVVLALIAIFVYILYRFRSVAYSVGSIVALTFDTLLIIGMYSICYGWIGFSLEIDQTFIGAILTAIGYSINDKVVVFDRIRENFTLYPRRDIQRLFNDSLNQTLSRTINTSLSTLIVLLAIFIFGGDSIRSFAFAMMLGVVFGTCSSIFIAAPTAFLVLGRKIREEGHEELEAEAVAAK